MFKKFACAAAALIVMFSASALAQEERAPRTRQKDTAPEVLFAPHFYLQFQDGINVTMFQRTAAEMTASPYTALSVGYNFTPVWGIRASGALSQGRGNYKNDWIYTYMDTRIYADAVVNLSNAFSGFRPKRVVDFSIYAGVGPVLGIENYHANTYSNNRPVRLKDAWKEGKIFLGAHAGGVLGIRLSPHVKGLIDAGVSFTDSRLNSKQSMLPSTLVSGTVGIEYDFNPNQH